MVTKTGKKMGRPAGVKNKPTSQYFKQRAAKAAAGFKDVRAEGKLHAEDEESLASADTAREFHILRDRVASALHPEEARLAQLIELQRMVKSLEHQAIGYRAVISYLEHTISSSIDK